MSLEDEVVELEPDAETLAYFEWLRQPDNNFHDIKLIGDRVYAGIKPLIFHWTLIVGHVGDEVGYFERWCYAHEMLAAAALAAWDGTGEPQGWHRHPNSGRRRPDGNPELEYIDP